MNKNINERLLFVVLIGLVLLIVIRLFIAVTELDIATIQREEEVQKLEYYRTLNRVYGGENDTL